MTISKHPSPESRIIANADFDDIKSNKLLIKDVLTAKEDEYYVFIYSSENNYDTLKQADLEPVIMRYFTYVHNNKKTNSDIIPIYGYDIDAYQPTADYKKCADYLTSLSSTFSISEVPVLVLVSEGNVSSVYKTIGGSNGIESTLTKAMNTETAE